MQPLISVVVVSKNRPHDLITCLRSLQRSTLSNFELIVIDQSDVPVLSSISPTFSQFKKVTYLHSSSKGKSKGLNQAIKVATSKIIAFTDDDCTVDKNWLKIILGAFKKNSSVYGVFGTTKPHQPYKHPEEICPSTFSLSRSKIITKGCKHWEHIGFGNNMAIRKESLIEIGMFNILLGPGSIGSNAEDGDIALRLILSGHPVAFEKKALIFHNKWLTKTEYLLQEYSYICGEIACYGALALRGYSFAREIIKEHITESFKEVKEVFLSMLKLNTYFFVILARFFLNLTARLRGCFVGFLSYLVFRTT